MNTTDRRSALRCLAWLKSCSPEIAIGERYTIVRQIVEMIPALSIAEFAGKLEGATWLDELQKSLKIFMENQNVES